MVLTREVEPTDDVNLGKRWWPQPERYTLLHS